MAFTLYLNLICALRSRHRLLARSEPFCSCTASCSQPPIPRASGLYRAPSAPGDRNCEAVPLGGPAVPLSPGVSLSMSTGWETGLSPSPSVRTPVKKKPLSDGVTDHSGTPDLVASVDGQLHQFTEPGGVTGFRDEMSIKGERAAFTAARCAGTETGGDCTAASAAEGIILNRLTKPDDSPACFVHQSTDAFGSGGLGDDGGGGGGLLGPLNGDTEFLLPPAGAIQAAASEGHREVVCRERAAAEAGGSQRGALEHPGGGHGRERGRCRAKGARSGSPALRESTGEWGAAALLARAGSAGGV